VAVLAFARAILIATARGSIGGDRTLAGAQKLGKAKKKEAGSRHGKQGKLRRGKPETKRKVSRSYATRKALILFIFIIIFIPTSHLSLVIRPLIRPPPALR
jgi:hypothetical protein